MDFNSLKHVSEIPIKFMRLFLTSKTLMYPVRYQVIGSSWPNGVMFPFFPIVALKAVLARQHTWS